MDHYEIQVGETHGVFWYTVCITSGKSSWTSPQVTLPGVDSMEQAHERAVSSVRALHNATGKTDGE